MYVMIYDFTSNSLSIASPIKVKVPKKTSVGRQVGPGDAAPGRLRGSPWPRRHAVDGAALRRGHRRGAALHGLRAAAAGATGRCLCGHGAGVTGTTIWLSYGG